MLSHKYFQMSEERWQPEDPSLQKFTANDYDVEGRATAILKQGNINDEVARLSAALASLDTTIQVRKSR